jgi:hypothetical protein
VTKKVNIALIGMVGASGAAATSICSLAPGRGKSLLERTLRSQTPAAAVPSWVEREQLI